MTDAQFAALLVIGTPATVGAGLLAGGLADRFGANASESVGATLLVGAVCAAVVGAVGRWVVRRGWL